MSEGSARTDRPLLCFYILALAFRCTSLPSHVLLRPVPAFLLRSPDPGHQLHPALLPPLQGLHRLHSAAHGRGHAARAHPQVLPAEHHGGLHGVGGGRELPALLRYSCGLPGTGQGRTAVPRHPAVGRPQRAPPPARASGAVRKGKRSTRPRLGERAKEMPLGFPAVAPGGR